MRKIGILLILAGLLFIAIPSQVSAEPLDFEWQCDVIEANPNSFLDDEMIRVWNSTTSKWEWVSIWYHLYWNGTGFDAPPLEYQMRSFNFTMSTTHNATKTMVMYTNSYPSPGSRFLGNITDHYVNHTYWIATNGVVHASSGPYRTLDNVSGYVENFMWNESGWYRFRVLGFYYDSWYETHDGDPSISFGDMYYFYLNITEEVETEPEVPIATDVIPNEGPMYIVSNFLVGIAETVIAVLEGIWDAVFGIFVG